METKPDEIIKAFDEVREYIFGYAFGRDNPNVGDKITAENWIKDGLTLVVSVMVFYEQMTWMHEKFLKFGHGKDRQYLPASLKIFDDNINAAVRRNKNGGQDLWENSIIQWHSRCIGWLKNSSLWRENMWGPQPFKEGNRVPRSILTEIKKKLELQ